MTNHEDENADQSAKGHSSYFGQVIDSLSSGVIVVHRDGTIITANPASREHLNLDESTLHEADRFDRVAGLEHFAEVMNEVLRTGEAVRRRELSLSEGEERKIIGMTASPIYADGMIAGVVFLFIDITEMRRLERVAALNRQLAQIGELTAGVVHELRNPISVIGGMAELLVRGLKEGSPLWERARAIQREALHMDQLVGRFLSFAKPFEITPRACSIALLVERAMALCETLASRTCVEIDRRVESAEGSVEADETLLSQALANLIRNGIEAAGKGGHVHIGARLDAGWAIFRVEDDGPGVRLEEGADIFGAFFSRKEGGTGLGLSIVHRTVSAHGGNVRHGNREGGGAWFELRIPVEFGQG